MNIIQSDQWETPDDLYNKLDEEFKFGIDLCAAKNGSNAKCDEYVSDLGKFVDKVDWTLPTCWMNPPYSRGNIDFCMETMVELAKSPCAGYPVIVTLTRFDPSASWFKQYVDGVADEVRMLAHRVKFKGAKNAYNFPCCISIYNESYRRCDWGLEDFNTKYHIWSWR